MKRTQPLNPAHVTRVCIPFSDGMPESVSLRMSSPSGAAADLEVEVGVSGKLPELEGDYTVFGSVFGRNELVVLVVMPRRGGTR